MTLQACLRKGFVLSVIVILCPSLGAQSDADINEGLRLLQQGDNKGALASFDRAKQKAPEDARAYFYSGLILSETGQSFQAMIELERALELDPANSRYALVYAEILVRNDYGPKAVAALGTVTKELALKKLTVEELWLFSDLLFRLGEYKKALPILEGYAIQKPGEEQTFFRMGQLGIALNDSEMALQAFNSALEKTSRKAEANYGLGLVYHRLADLEKAKSVMLDAVEVSPENPEYVHLLATILNENGEPQKALDYLSKVEHLGETTPKIYDAFAKSYRQLKNAEEALKYAKKFQALQLGDKQLQDESNKVQLILKAGQDLSEAGDGQAALSKFAEALELDPDNLLAHSYLAGIYITMGNNVLASRHLARLHEIAPDSFETNFLSAQNDYQRGQFSEALEFAAKAKALQPSYPDLRNLLGNIYYALGELEKAKEEYSSAMNLAPGRSEFRLNFESVSRKLEPN